MSDLQTKWRFCVKCSVMFYNGFYSRGSCPSDGNQHAPLGLNFQLPHDGPETDHARANWRLCRRCFAMHFGPAANQACNLGGRHDPTGSLNFVLPHSTPETGDAQSSWRFCTKCSDLFYERATEQHCSAGGRHAAAGLVFTLPHRADHVYDTGPVPSPLALGGWAQLAIRPDGSYTFRTHAHDSGATNIDYVFGAVLVTTGTASPLPSGTRATSRGPPAPCSARPTGPTTRRRTGPTSALRPSTTTSPTQTWSPA